MRRRKFLKMQIKICTISALDGKAQEEEMNRFLRGHKIVSVDKHYSESSSSWNFCITYVENNVSAAGFLPKKEKVDYREVLDETTFARFAKLREARKQIAADEAVPAYSVFTNEELAEIATLEEFTTGSIKKINGIGEKRAEKYEQRLFELYNQLQES